MYTPQIFLSYLQYRYAATLPSEIRKCKNVTDFDSIRNKLFKCSCGHFKHLI